MIKMDEKCRIEEKQRVKVKRQDESEWKVQIKDEYEREKRKKKGMHQPGIELGSYVWET